tara:strand:- start:301 stop:507 length:207 start_codon:yes stop_codon:yes gene_type:complete
MSEARVSSFDPSFIARKIKKQLVKFSKGYYNYTKPPGNALHVSEKYPKASLKRMFTNTKSNYSNMGKK